jgi:putative inorganic carbon (HCO3(-)) transporter
VSGGAPLVALLVLTAMAVGVLSVKRPGYAAALVLAAALIVVVATRIEALPLALVCTIFIESVSLGGLTVGRIAGALALAVIAYYVLAHGRVALRLTPLLAVVGAYGFWILLSAYWADSPSAVYSTLFGYVLVIAYMLAFALLVRSPRDAVNVLVVLAAGATLAGFVALNTYLVTGGATRATGLEGADHADTFGVYQAMIAPMALGLFALTRSARARMIYLGCMGVIVLSIVSSLTRTAMVAVGVVAIVALVAPWRFLFRSAAQRATYAVAVAVTAGVVLTVAASATFISRLGSIFSGGQTDRAAGRTDLWAAALNAYGHHPWLGIGAGNFQAHSLDLLTRTQGVDIGAAYVGQGRPVHNAYLEALTELGPVGLALFVLVIAMTAWYLVRVFRRARAAGDDLTRIASATLLLGLLSLAVSLGFLSIELNKPLWIIVGLTIALERMSGERGADGAVVHRRRRRAREPHPGAAPA